jgi:hypothetical protein
LAEKEKNNTITAKEIEEKKQQYLATVVPPFSPSKPPMAL